ncbi:hypothetical protein NA57DRAFT_70942 [Rhizodiscina lignyota]|uniref:Pyridoxamine 5'-phosphate oxidase N-terminal domain-containing protein n=1 Tax=Rhizodiscina lignyota TaxID=1504668 RepID=A0A9P4ING0_9PEZI|nr:hypothetical protein NA57DRAFT_70942 [Rhizodiscina lignyota]
MATTVPPSSTLPPEVITCLQNARFLHLATSHANQPHISLMNYTYLPSTPFRSTPTIIMTTPPASNSKKTANLLANPQVSLLVHDWVSHRPPTLSSPDQQTSTAGDGNSASGGSAVRSQSPSGRGASSLASLLLGINTAALSRISVTLNGVAEILPEDSEEANWCKARHVENNTFEPGQSSSIGSGIFGGSNAASGDGDGGAGCYIEGEEVRVVVVRIQDGRLSDWKGRVEDWTVGDGEGEGLVNGA